MITYHDIYSFVVDSYMNTIDCFRDVSVSDWMHFISTDIYYYYTMF